MRPLPTIADHLLTISCTPHELVCSLIRPTRIAHRYELYAYHHYPFQSACEQLPISNPTLLRSYIQEVVTLHKLEHGMAALVLNGPGIAERIATLASAHPNYQQIVDPRLKGFIWDSYYLYPEENSSQYAFYVAGIKQALLLQYKLLFCTLPLHLIGITTESMALLYLYKTLYGSTFRRSQLAHDIQKTNHTLHPLISAEALRRSLAINPTLSVPAWYDAPTLRTALGLYLLGRTAYETN